MKQGSRVGLALSAVLAAGAGGYWGGQRDVALPLLLWAGDHLRPRIVTTDTTTLQPTPPGPGPSDATMTAGPPPARHVGSGRLLSRP